MINTMPHVVISGEESMKIFDFLVSNIIFMNTLKINNYSNIHYCGTNGMLMLLNNVYSQSQVTR